MRINEAAKFVGKGACIVLMNNGDRIDAVVKGASGQGVLIANSDGKRYVLPQAIDRIELATVDAMQFPQRINVPNDSTRTYATLAALDRALIKLGFNHWRHMVVYRADGRCTAVFVDREANPVIFAGFAWVF